MGGGRIPLLAPRHPPLRFYARCGRGGLYFGEEGAAAGRVCGRVGARHGRSFSLHDYICSYIRRGIFLFLFFPFRPRRFKVAKINRTIIIIRALQYRKPSCVLHTGQVTYACTTVRVFALLCRQNINMYINLIVIYSVYITIVARCRVRLSDIFAIFPSICPTPSRPAVAP